MASTAVAVRTGVRSGRTPLPAPQSRPVEPLGETAIGDTGLGRVEVTPAVVGKLAGRAALEVPDVGAAASTLLGRELPGSLGGRTALGAVPSADAEVDGALAYVTITISVRYPAPVRSTAAAVRTAVRERLQQLAGLEVVEVDVHVPALVTDLPRAPRVH